MSGGCESNKGKARGYLERFSGNPLGHFIDGAEVAGVSGATFVNTTPIDNSPINSVAAGNAEDIDRAVRSARDAFPGWRALAGSRRRALLHAIADAIEARAEEIALVESWDTGQPLRFMSKAAIRGAENFRFVAVRAPGAGNGLSQPTEDHMNHTLRQPLGPAGVVTAWNTPFMLSSCKIASAPAAGCTVDHKPANGVR